ncbi:hypothetical protein [Marinimicrobium locisalis]|uniref:hypothetical protein n=1 Tax=Marinimicrobium locisalis TaxID=546022 RepID=UPI003221B5B6
MTLTSPLVRLLCALSLATLLTACGGESSGVGRLDLRAPDSGMRPARPGASYAHALEPCARLYVRGGNNSFDPCTLEQLPLLGQAQRDITVEAIMGRTLVSHDWMAERFEQSLNALPQDLRTLFGGVTAVVIGAEIRPSYYWLSTGAIYLDPANLWLTIEERDTISREPDYRSGFDAELQFDTLGRYVRDGDYAWYSAPLSGPGEERPLDAILPPMAALLFHELAHANDYIPPSEHATLDPAWHVAEAATQLQSESVSAALAGTYPLNSMLMMDLAEVMFQGRTASDSERALRAREVGLEFATDFATDSYAYVNGGDRELFFEDTAMLFEEAMMQHHFGVMRDMAFTDRPEEENVSCNDYVVRWGSRGRVGHEQIRPRVALVLSLLLDDPDVTPYIDELEPAERLTNNIGWCANLQRQAIGIHGEAGSRWQEPLPRQQRDRHAPGHPHHNH